MLLDANVLVYSIDTSSSAHDPARRWLVEALAGPVRLALPWQTIGAFVRLVTHPRVLERPLSGPVAWGVVEQWLAQPVVWIPAADAGTADILGRLIRRYDVRRNLVPDAQLAALAVQHGVPVVSADPDFARFEEVRWVNPVRG